MIKVLKGAALAAAGFSALSFTSPAFAFDDRPSTFAPLMSFIGVGKDEPAKGDIDFRERAPIVVPKNLALPAPQPGVGPKVANWPKDPDVSRRRDEDARARVPQQIYINANPALDKRELMQGRSDAAPVAVDLCDTFVNGVRDCAPTPMEKVKRVFSLGDTNRDVILVGKEPTREYLTEPPRGFRTASETTKATREGGYERPNDADPGKYYRDEAKRNSDYR